jgi:hypothetical protein
MPTKKKRVSRKKSKPRKKVKHRVKRKPAKATHVKRVGRKRKNVYYKVGSKTPAQLRSQLRNRLEAELSDLMLKHYKATTIKATKFYDKKIARVKKELKALC